MCAERGMPACSNSAALAHKVRSGTPARAALIWVLTYRDTTVLALTRSCCDQSAYNPLGKLLTKSIMGESTVAHQVGVLEGLSRTRSFEFKLLDLRSCYHRIGQTSQATF